jgi:hypothetical protein
VTREIKKERHEAREIFMHLSVLADTHATEGQDGTLGGQPVGVGLELGLDQGEQGAQESFVEGSREVVHGLLGGGLMGEREGNGRKGNGNGNGNGNGKRIPRMET